MTQGWYVILGEFGMHFVIAIVAAYTYAAFVGWLMIWRGGLAFWLGITLGTSALFFPLLIPPDLVVQRAMCALLCTGAMFKIIDFARYGRGNGFPSYGQYLYFLIPFPPLLVVYRRSNHQSSHLLPWTREFGRAVLFGAILLSAFGLLHVSLSVPLLQASYLLDHALKLILLLLAVESLSQMSWGLERLFGYQTAPLMRQVYRSLSIGDFWRRYNTRVHRWLAINVFHPAGGAQAPIRATLLTFFVSAVHHELMFGIATSRFDGYQFAFFMLQAPAVLLSDYATRLRWLPKAVPYVGMLIWFYFTSMLFCHGVERVFSSYYASEPWLP